MDSGISCVMGYRDLMLPRERQIEIVKVVDRDGTVKTTSLAEFLQCTEETIRRDLDALEREGRVVRSHGGAMSVRESLGEIQHHARKSRQKKEKAEIAEVACQYINEGEAIFLDESSTVLAMVKHLPRKVKFTVVTTSELVSTQVRQMSNVKLYILGGLYDELSHSYGGFLAEQAMSCLTVDRFFFSCKGIAEKVGATEGAEERARLKKRLLESARWACALADHTKVGIKSKFSFIFPKSIDLLITDSLCSSAKLAELEKAGIKTITKKIT